MLRSLPLCACYFWFAIAECGLATTGQTHPTMRGGMLKELIVTKMRLLGLLLLLLGGCQLSWAAAPKLAQIDALLTRQDYRQAQPLMRVLLDKRQPSAQERALIYRWLFARDDGAELERRASGGQAPVDRLAIARLALELGDFPRAEAGFQQVLAQASRASPASERATALKGLGQVAFQRLDFDLAHSHLRASLAAEPSAEAWIALSETLVRLGRTDDAVDAAERSLALNPYQELAHYQLGNGYTRKNYSQLEAQYGAAFTQAMALVRRASDAFEQGRFEQARALSFKALGLCPELGRAHAVLAKALESQRFQIDVHRAAYEQRFAATAMPEVPGIERYVSNWDQLSPRHQKRVALSLAPWKAFIPVLVEGGARHFIKPLYMRLSETPSAQSMKDQRIGYDSRLWDDVRGMGGYNTVTGIEDVERSIFDRYNTVLHELSHQVHGVLTADQWREIQALYNRAKLRNATSKQGFLSRYAGGSVWEYFAEGANAFDSPRRDAYDPREIVRERLQARDPELLALVGKLFSQSDVSASLPIAYVAAGQNEIGDGRLEPGLAYLARALKVAPADELVLSANLHGLSLKGKSERERVPVLAQQALALYPASGAVRTTVAEALWHAGRPLDEAVAVLANGRDQLSGDDRFQVDLALANYQLKLGRTSAALASYDAVLAHQADSPEGLWGKAATLALAERWDEAFTLYGQVLRLRTGLVALRADFIRDLLRAGRLEPARAQLKDALLLDANDPSLLALQAWLSLLTEPDASTALRQAVAAHELGPWCDLALIVKAAALRASGREAESTEALAPLRLRIAEGSAPDYVYLSQQSSWVSVHELPAVERGLLERLPRR